MESNSKHAVAHVLIPTRQPNRSGQSALLAHGVAFTHLFVRASQSRSVKPQLGNPSAHGVPMVKLPLGLSRAISSVDEHAVDNAINVTVPMAIDAR